MGIRLFQDIIRGGNKPEWLSWDAVRLATDHFSLDVFSNSASDFNLVTVHKVDSLEFKEKLLKTILQTQDTQANSAIYYPLVGTIYAGGVLRSSDGIKAIDIMKSVIQETNDIELKELFERELLHAAEYKERFRQRSEESLREARARSETSPEHQKRQLAKQAFMSQMSKLSDQGSNSRPASRGTD